jgi:hypothetical protein
VGVDLRKDIHKLERFKYSTYSLFFFVSTGMDSRACVVIVPQGQTRMEQINRGKELLFWLNPGRHYEKP